MAPTIGRQKPYARTQEEEDYGDSRSYDARAGPRGDENGRPKGLTAVRLFWLNSLIVTVGTCMLGLLWNITKAPGGAPTDWGFLIVGVILLLLIFPAVQLAAAFVTFLVLAISSRPDKGYQFGQIGKISLGIVAGTVLGIVIMTAAGFLLRVLV